MVTLLGAGFSKDFGMPLATELGAQIATVLANNGYEDLGIELLKEPGFDFEKLIENKARGRKDNEIRVLYNAAKESLERADFTIQKQLSIPVGHKESREVAALIEWLATMGPIFTLNYDLLVERNYYNDESSMPLCRPGLRTVLDNSQKGVFDRACASVPLKEFLSRIDRQEVSAIACAQPGHYVKLHGTLDSGNRLMGANKGSRMLEDELMGEYKNLFERTLEGDPKLLAIGYSFRDYHINNIIKKLAIQKRLRLFIWNPVNGAELIADVDNSTPAQEAKLSPWLRGVIVDRVLPSVRQAYPTMQGALSGIDAFAKYERPKGGIGNL